MLATEIKVPLFLFEVLPILIEMCLHVLLELLILGS